jgi:ATP-dependent Clp protease ATP-binding subunit ClpC
VFQRFTERARQSVVFAQDEARSLRHNYIGTEHLLLGLLREQDGVAARVLAELEIGLDGTRAEVRAIIGEGDAVTPGQIPFTPRAKKILELSLREALALGHNSIGTEHLLLAIGRANEGVAMDVLVRHGIGAETLHDAVIRGLGGPAVTGAAPRPFPRRRKRRRTLPVEALLLGWALFGVAAGFGLLLGWLIWG